MTKEQRQRFTICHEGIAILLTKNERIARKTDERIPNPDLYRLINGMGFKAKQFVTKCWAHNIFEKF